MKGNFVKRIGFLVIFILITLLATQVFALEAIATTKFIVKNDVIMRIDTGTTVGKFLENVTVNLGADKAVYKGTTKLGNNDLLGTGMTLKIGNDTTYNIAVRGDINGDTKLSVTDLSLAKAHIISLTLQEGIYEKAVDINCDMKVSIIDLSLIKMLLVGLPLPETELPNINGDITILPETTSYVKELGINVYWPDDTTGLTKQVSLDNGRTYQNYTGKLTMKANSTVIARLVDEDSRIVKSASLVVTNIDNTAPEKFDVTVEHKISNYTTLTGSTTDTISGIAGYYFSYDNGANWYPLSGLLNGKYTFTNVPDNTKIYLKMKATDKVGNETTTDTKEQRTFKKGIDILAENLTGIAVDKDKQIITMPDGRIFKLVITENGGYAIINMGEEIDVEEQLEEEKMLNEKIAEYEENGTLSVEEILTRLTEDGYGAGTLENEIFTTEKAERFIQYKLIRNTNDKHEVIFIQAIVKNGLTSSGQIAEAATLEALEKLIDEMVKADANVKVLDILDRAVREGILLEENINRNNGRFETEVGLTYELTKEEGSYIIDLIGFAEDVEAGYIGEKLLSVLDQGLKNQIIDWAIEDGLTTEEKASRVNGIYETNNGEYKEIVIDFEEGTYETVAITEPEGAIIEYKLNPDFPTMTNKTQLEVTAKGNSEITKLEVFSALGESLLVENYTDNALTKTATIDISYNGIYFVRVTTSDGKISEKEILISNIASILPIRVTINPETPINTTTTGIQNDVAMGPISVTLKYSAAPLFENEDKYQYQLYTTTGEWQVAKQEELIENITTNCKIYARYYDGEKSVKQVEINIDTVDNIAPNAFEYTTIVTSNSITVEAFTEDTATDSNGVVAREGVEGIGQYLYKLGDGEWQVNNIFENLTQNTSYKISVKAIDYAGNETVATNSNTDVKTNEVPKASDVISFEYSETKMTKENVIVKFNSSIQDNPYIIQYQAISDGTEPKADAWIDGEEFEAIGNCKIYVRLVDSTGQENKDKGYAEGEIANIDNMGPIEFTPKATATTKNSITIQASSVGNGEAKDTTATNTTASSGTVKYDYYITDMSGDTTIIEDQTEYTYTFTGLEQGSLHAIYVIATDAVGNSTISNGITVVTNGTLNEYAKAHTTITGLKEDAAYNNPIIPAGFAPVNEGGAEWGDGSTTPEGWNEGLVIRDEDGNEFVWVPVDGTDVTYEKWLTKGISYLAVKDGEGPLVNEEEITEEAQVAEYGGFYVARYEASKNGAEPTSKSGDTPWAGNNYSNAKEKAEKMYNSNVLQSGLITGTQWDTVMKWLSNTNEGILESLEHGNFTDVRKNTGSSEDYKINNIYDLSGNVQEITNELYGEQVVVRGGAYDLDKTLDERYTYSQEYANSNLGFRTVLYVIETEDLIPTNPGALGIGNINEGPGNVTINAGTASYLNPAVPVGFKAVNTADAKWYGLPTPRDWNKGLVIEDVDGNQFVWVPVDGNKIKYEKWYTIYAPQTIIASDVEGDELPLALQELGEEEQAQIKKYGGFYVARYEAGNFEGTLASKAGIKTVSAVTYKEAKEYAEGMYASANVKSGLLTGTAWDTVMKWMASRNGNNTVLNDKTTGNNPNNEFTFSGEYAEGPDSLKEIRGEYKTGTNVTKDKNEKVLLATGLLESSKINNIYDMAGNVWEYTYEYSLNGANQKEYIARGADYYRKYSINAKWGAAIRENITEEVGTKRNEGGFRVMLYLVEGSAEVGKYEEFNRTMTGKPSTYNNPIIPAGFAPVNKGAAWGNGTLETIEWNKGLVIEDQAGNEFVWVPVDGKDVEYENWIQTGISYKETDGNELPETVKNWGEDELTQINRYGGFYIARFEASKVITDTSITGGSKSGVEAWTNIDYVTAKQMAESMVTKDNVKTGLVTGTAWDIVMKWIANEKGVSAVIEDSASWGHYLNSTLGNSASAKNINLLAGGNWEWTAEKVGTSAVYRGGVRTDNGNSSPAGYRGTKGTTTLDEATTFRMMLYVTGDVVGSVTKPVTEAEILYGTMFPNNANAPLLAAGMTPVKWNGVTWVTTTADDVDWYSYNDVTLDGANTSKWANARTPDGSMWVWIPRYAYKIDYINSSKPSAGGKINIIFLDSNTNEPLQATDETIYAKAGNGISTSKNYVVHPAFRGDTSIGGWTKELTGIWVGKFESSGTSATTVASKPNVGSFAYSGQGSQQYVYALSATLGLAEKSDLPKAPEEPVRRTKVEYGILGIPVGHYYVYVYNGREYSASQYRSVMEMYYEDLEEFNAALSKFKTFDSHMAKNTEWGAVAYLAHSVYGVNGASITKNPKAIAGYQYTTNTNQSTTGNVYGVYDMAGGRAEYSAAYYSNYVPARYGNIYDIATAGMQYKQVYYNVNSYYGDAIGETAGWQGSSSLMPNRGNKPLFVRGVIYGSYAYTAYGSGDTMFSTSTQCSNTNYAYSFRMVLINK